MQMRMVINRVLYTVHVHGWTSGSEHHPFNIIEIRNRGNRDPSIISLLLLLYPLAVS